MPMEDTATAARQQETPRPIKSAAPRLHKPAPERKPAATAARHPQEGGAEPKPVEEKPVAVVETPTPAVSGPVDIDQDLGL